MNAIWDQAIQLTGAVLILAAFAGTQAGWLSHKSPGYLLTNMVGSAGLAAVAVPAHQWGFLLLEGAWSITALSGLVTVLARRLLRGDPPAAPGGHRTRVGPR
ncbi:MAG TPA: hypothetical protein VGA04_30770 [Streptosporangiaceae bacterium]